MKLFHKPNSLRCAASIGAGASIIEDKERNDLDIHFPYIVMPFVMNAVKTSGCKIIHQYFQ